MRRLVCAALMIAAASSMSYGAVLCSSLIGQDVSAANSSGGCTVGNLLFNNFSYSLAGGSGLSSSQIEISGVFTGGPAGTSGLNFNPNLDPNTSGVTDLHFAFSVTGPSSSIVLAFLFNGGTANTSIQERVCDSLGVSLSGLCTGSQIGSDMVAGGGQTSSTSFAGQTTIWIWKDINAPSNTNYHLSSFDQGFAIPEPMTLSLMGFGLLGIGLIGRRVRK
jgi:hypothetical protein